MVDQQKYDYVDLVLNQNGERQKNDSKGKQHYYIRIP